MQVFRGRVVTPTEIIDDGALAAESGTLTYVGSWEDAPAAVRSSEVAPAPAQYLLPGLVDVHNHGGGGVSFPDTERVEDVARGVAEHQAHGTMRMLASLVTASAETLRERVSLLADAADEVIIAGIPPIDHAPENAADFNHSLQEFASQRGWQWVDAGVAVRTPENRFARGMAIDGVHPTAAGAKRLGESVAIAIDELPG